MARDATTKKGLGWQNHMIVIRTYDLSYEMQKKLNLNENNNNDLFCPLNLYHFALLGALEA